VSFDELNAMKAEKEINGLNKATLFAVARLHCLILARMLEGLAFFLGTLGF
jgi:hypothetical protein